MMQSARIIASRLSLVPSVAARAFSGACEPAQRIRDVLAEYRQENFSREIPSRFKKQVLQPYIGSNNSVDVEQLNRLLKNIGHPETCLSVDEQDELLREAGSNDRSITVKQMMELID